MIEAVIKSTGNIVGKPVINRVIIENESDIAVRRKDDETNKIEQFTIGELFDSYNKKSSYRSNMPDSSLFEEWFSSKYIRGRNLESRIISVQFYRV
jgi:hypothetical protein